MLPRGTPAPLSGERGGPPRLGASALPRTCAPMPLHPRLALGAGQTLWALVKRSGRASAPRPRPRRARPCTRGLQATPVRLAVLTSAATCVAGRAGRCSNTGRGGATGIRKRETRSSESAVAHREKVELASPSRTYVPGGRLRRALACRTCARVMMDGQTKRGGARGRRCRAGGTAWRRRAGILDRVGEWAE